jgi:hypothetical protein
MFAIVGGFRMFLIVSFTPFIMVCFRLYAISRGREETDDSEKMYINYGSFRKIS